MMICGILKLISMEIYLVGRFYPPNDNSPVAFRSPYVEVSEEVFMDKFFDCMNEHRRKKKMREPVNSNDAKEVWAPGQTTVEFLDEATVTYEELLHRLNDDTELVVDTTIFKIEKVL
jgi:hypothetical protein